MTDQSELDDRLTLSSAQSWDTALYLQDELEIAELRIEQLEAALVNARRVGAAAGIIMASRQVTYDDALRMMSHAGQQAGEKLRTVADRVLVTGSTTRPSSNR